MHLREVSLRIAQKLARGGFPTRLPDSSLLEELVRQLEAMPATAGKPANVDYNRLAAELSRDILDGIPLTTRQLRRAAWCLWQTEPALAAELSLLGPLLKALQQVDSARPYLAFASSWLLEFRPDLPHVKEVAAALRQLAKKWPTRLSEAHEAYAIFHETEGPRKLAALLLKRRQPITFIFQEIGLSALAANGGYAQAVTESLFEKLADGKEKDPLQRLEIVETVGIVDKRPIFPILNPKMIAALLKPFLKEGDPRQETRDKLLQFVLSTLRDPRLKPDFWINVDPSLRSVVVRWLSQQSLRQFFDIVDDTADKYMWPYRRAFWEAVYSCYEEAGVEVEAWVAFGETGALRARQAFGASASFGRLKQDGKQLDPGHAVLLLRIGNTFVADWSHNGKCNVWLEPEVDGCPTLYRSVYGSDEVRIVSGAGNREWPDRISWVHGSSESYTWQDKIAGVLAKRLRRRVPRARYTVTR